MKRLPLNLLLVGVVMLVLAAGISATGSSVAAPTSGSTAEDNFKPRLEDTAITAQPSKKELRVVADESVKTLAQGGIHDMANDAAVVLQDPTESMAKFPQDRRKAVDWVKTMQDGMIAPRADVRGEGKMNVLDLDVIMKDTAAMPWVKFPHLAHTQWLDCSNCHPDIFEPVDNGNPVTMSKVLRGEYCGICHDKVAFMLFTCERCHNTAKTP